MSNKQQTALEWFHEKTWNLKIELELGGISIAKYASTYSALYKQAKEMEKEQIINAHGDEQSKLQDDGTWRVQTAEDYYNETYGGK